MACENNSDKTSHTSLKHYELTCSTLAVCDHAAALHKKPATLLCYKQHPAQRK